MGDRGNSGFCFVDCQDCLRRLPAHTSRLSRLNVDPAVGPRIANDDIPGTYCNYSFSASRRFGLQPLRLVAASACVATGSG